MRPLSGHPPAGVRLSVLQALMRHPPAARSPCTCAPLGSVHMRSAASGEMSWDAAHSSSRSSSAAGSADASASCKQPTPVPIMHAAQRPSQHARPPPRPPQRSRQPTVSQPVDASPATAQTGRAAPAAAAAAAAIGWAVSTAGSRAAQLSVGGPMAWPTTTPPRSQRRTAFRPPTASVAPSTAARAPAVPCPPTCRKQPQAARRHPGQHTASPAVRPNSHPPRRRHMRLSESVPSSAAATLVAVNDRGIICWECNADALPADMGEADALADAAFCIEQHGTMQHGGMYRSVAVVAVADLNCRSIDEEWQMLQATHAVLELNGTIISSSSTDRDSTSSDSSRQGSSSSGSSSIDDDIDISTPASNRGTASTSASASSITPAPAAAKVCPPRGRPRRPRQSASMSPQPASGHSLLTQHLQQQDKQLQRRRRSRQPLSPTDEAWEAETEAALLALQSVAPQLEQLELHHIGPADALQSGVQVMLVSVHQPDGPDGEARLYLTQDRAVPATTATATADQGPGCSHNEGNSSSSSSNTSSRGGDHSKAIGNATNTSATNTSRSNGSTGLLPEQQQQPQERQPFMLAPGLSFAPTADASCGDWHVYVITVAGGFSPSSSEEHTMFPNAVRHVGSRRISHNMRNAQDLAEFLAEAKEEAVKGHALNVVRCAIINRDVFCSPDWCMDRLVDRWGAGPLEAFGVTRSYVNSLGLQHLRR